MDSNYQNQSQPTTTQSAPTTPYQQPTATPYQQTAQPYQQTTQPYQQAAPSSPYQQTQTYQQTSSFQQSQATPQYQSYQATPAYQAAPTYYAQQQPKEKTSVIGIISLVCGCIGFLTGIFFIGLVLDVAAIVLAVISMVNKEPQKGFAIGGLVASGLSIILVVIYYVCIFSVALY